MSENTLDYTGRVAVVTGAGRGIGQAYAGLLADRGAKVVVNDLGVAMDGDSAAESPAHSAAEAISARGGTAVANTSDVTTADGARALIDTAIGAFGRLDIVINNAGIFTNDAFPEMDAQWLSRQFAVHIQGSFNVTQAAWPHMTEAGYGRVVLTTSTSALGADNTVAYGTAKAAVLGLGRSLAQVGRKKGIKVNMVAPMAFTRMMAAGLHDAGIAVPDEIADRGPDLVAPLVALLCHESCPVNGEAFVDGLRRMSRLFIGETVGYTHPGLDLTPEIVRDEWDSIVDLEGFRLLTDTMRWTVINEKEIANSPLPVRTAAGDGISE
ncbi:SDR family NAD(P)-dependent oxidoreductase [Nocardia miyunensis]|uniref:SDR family NAD(P)-dependent oxidoreductase n=1 Tax=Nocardia miyunensis TaxID=282684 RepID=UPI00082EBE61|nr:SDR family NAD(P)-dependent oxidoreductase [Nocardia miyunensis]